MLTLKNQTETGDANVKQIKLKWSTLTLTLNQIKPKEPDEVVI